MSVVAAATVPLSTPSSSIMVVAVLVEKSLLLEGHRQFSSGFVTEANPSARRVVRPVCKEEGTGKLLLH